MIFFLRAGAVGLALTTMAFANANAQDNNLANGLSIPRSSLTQAEQARAIALAEPQSTIATASALHPDAVNARNSPNRVVVTDVEAVGADKSSARLAVVTSYQYEGNLTINRLVDLSSGQVVNEERMQNGGARFTNVEIEYARQLLMADARVRQLVAPLNGQETFSFLLSVTPDQNDPLYGKRVVNVLINTPDGYLTEIPRIAVNLTDAAVVVTPQP